MALRSTLFAVVVLALGSCWSGAGDEFGSPCLNCSVAQRALTAKQVESITLQAVAEATAQGRCVTIAVTDRVGNVLGVYDMNKGRCSLAEKPGRPVPQVHISSGYPGRNGGLEGRAVPSWQGAVSKALTAAYLSSAGNAFSTRTASEIIREHFPPGVSFQPSGPLFGVQLSQLPCSDVLRSALLADPIGPQRSPLGLSGSPGGLPLYESGVLVGGVGVIDREGIYGLGLGSSRLQESADEQVALAGSWGFSAPAAIRADQLVLQGSLLPFTDSSSTLSDPALADPALLHTAGQLETAPGFFRAADGYRNGQAYGSAGSGVIPDPSGDFSDLAGFVLVDGTARNRFPPLPGSAGLGAAEVLGLLRAGLEVAGQARSDLRHPLGSTAQVTLSVVDLDGDILGMVRTPDAPIFGIDVSVQKARTAVLFSRPDAAALLEELPGGYLGPAVAFLGSDPFGRIAFSARAIGELSRPFFPDGVDGTAAGPFARSFADWSPFDDGLELDAVYDALGGATFSNPGCTANPEAARNGLQIFPGGTPIYRDGTLIGGIGVSGDGVDQDDMISFLGLSLAGQALGTLGNAPEAIRADTLAPRGEPLRFVECPLSPWVDSTAQDVCEGR